MLKPILRRIQRPQPATPIAIAALFVALGSSATAAVLLTGKQIRNGTITGADIKNRSIPPKKLTTLNFGQRAGQSLGGTQGPGGEQGPQGPPGADGMPGPPGKSCIEDLGEDACRGLPGADGQNGQDGQNGENGKDGKQGLAGVGVTYAGTILVDGKKGPKVTADGVGAKDFKTSHPSAGVYAIAYDTPLDDDTSDPNKPEPTIVSVTATASDASQSLPIGTTVTSEDINQDPDIVDIKQTITVTVNPSSPTDAPFSISILGGVGAQ